MLSYLDNVTLITAVYAMSTPPDSERISCGGSIISTRRLSSIRVVAWELHKLPTNKNPSSPDSVQFRPILHMIARTRWGVGRPFSPPVLTCLRFVSEICFLFSSHAHYRVNNALEGWRLIVVRSLILSVSHPNHELFEGGCSRNPTINNI